MVFSGFASPPPNQGNYLPEIRKDLKICEANNEKSSVNEPPEIELKDLPPHLEYAFLEGNDKLPVIIAKDLKNEEKAALIEVLKSHKQAIAWKLSDIKGIDPEFCTHKILMEEDYEPTVQHQRRVNPKIHDVIKKEVEKLLDAGLIYPISDSPWVSPVHCVPKKGGMTVVKNDENDLIPTRLVTGWRVCIDYRKLNEATRKDHFPLPFMDQMLERLAGNQFYCFLDGFSGYFQIPIDPKDQEKTTFTCPYGTFAYRRMPFGLCNAPGTFQRCMMAIFHDMIEKTMEVFMLSFQYWGILSTSAYPLGTKYALKPKTVAMWILLLLRIVVIIRDKKGAENLATDHLSRLTGTLIKIILGKRELHVFLVKGMLSIPTAREARDILEACHNGPTGNIMVQNLTSPEKVLLKYGVTSCLPRVSSSEQVGQVEVSNRGFLKMNFLNGPVGETVLWSDKLVTLFWAFRTLSIQNTIGSVLRYKLYIWKGKSLPIESRAQVTGPLDVKPLILQKLRAIIAQFS
ncbi:reverse transcriptase domain-containing protein [Tanacetum coccineum]|uniref:Reverse transcriptase domain-containing protein n=1 Tax=Tanacetum coccineum TaxID=301880 RepID=A0ABQ5CSU2_9ASTR